MLVLETFGYKYNDLKVQQAILKTALSASPGRGWMGLINSEVIGLWQSLLHQMLILPPVLFLDNAFMQGCEPKQEAPQLVVSVFLNWWFAPTPNQTSKNVGWIHTAPFRSKILVIIPTTFPIKRCKSTSFPRNFTSWKAKICYLPSPRHLVNVQAKVYIISIHCQAKH